MFDASGSGRVAIGIDLDELTAVDRDLLRLHRLRNLAHQFDRQQAVSQVGLFDPHEIGEFETALDAAVGDADLQEDRKSVVSGKSVAVRVDLVGRLYIKTKTQTNI